jgi:serine/threonine protein kinase
MSSSKVTVAGPERGAKNVLEQQMSVYTSTEGAKFEVPQSFRVISVLGSGAYGTVFAAEVNGSDEVVAVKKFGNPFSHLLYAKRTLREIRFLRFLRHENVIEMRGIYCSGTTQQNIGDM